MSDPTQLDRIESRLAAMDQRLARVETKTDTDLSLSRAQLQEQFLMATNFAGIEQSVAQTRDTEEAAIVLLGQLHDLIIAAGTDQTKLDDLASQLNAKKEALAAAVVNFTPAP